MNDHFYDARGGRLTGGEVVCELLSFMLADTGWQYRITIGTDSDGLNNGHKTEFVTAIVIHRVGNGGRYFWRRLNAEKLHTLRDRVIREVLISLDAAKEILTALKEVTLTREGAVIPEWEFEIHVDIGENGKTKTMMKEVLAMIHANNFLARVKPESYAASHVADRHV
jgi:predicted RNase H-related nuclease YkuK (DUF458 family)